MEENIQSDVIIIGGSYAGLAAAMALGRAMRKVLIIDSGIPCNRQTPHSHNFLTQDGTPPAEIAALARKQVLLYSTVSIKEGTITKGRRTETGFDLHTADGQLFRAKKLIFATGIKDIMPDIHGLDACWGSTVLHCPYCHGYEVRNKTTGILGNGEYGYEFAVLLSNWTNDLTLFTNGKSTLTAKQASQLSEHKIQIRETEIQMLEHEKGYLKNIIFKDGSKAHVDVIYTRLKFEQHCAVPVALGCELTNDGYIKADPSQKTSVHGIFACGDNTSRMRTVANAVSMGTTAGMMVNKELTEELF